MRISKTTNDRGKQFARELEEFFVSYHQAQPWAVSDLWFLPFSCGNLNLAIVTGWSLSLPLYLSSFCAPFLFLFHLTGGAFLGLEGGTSVLEELLLPTAEHRGPQTQFFT